ncbi:potassium channel KAT3 [Cryptomeria japonica]|uniref:potassium channel KAT3 n=1 Tax=Cryptomeria japonica TaxID=3369 RepID=UPI0027D9F554|nr:potassium channel KAT3 [Cryptomeria japonica]
MLLQFVAEMKGEYFPQNADIILKNQIPGDFYIIISGTVNIFTHANGSEQFLEKEGTPNLIGEIAVLLDIPQPFTLRTTKLSQLLRLGP